MPQNICYLCGDLLPENPNNDHVPPRQIHGKEIRRWQKLNLLTKPTHPACNGSYQFDEDYFVNTLVGLAGETYSGGAVWRDLEAAARQGKRLSLLMRIVGEFEERPSGIILLNDQVVKRQDGKRIGRIAWKIIRGLYFDHTDKFLPEDTPHKFLEQWMPGDGPSTYLPLFGGQPSHGRYPDIFDYKFTEVPQRKWANLWAFLLWDKILMIQVFQNPQLTVTSA